MDEIFDRLKAIKIKRKYLVASLVATELLGIFVFIWLLRVPLSRKFLDAEQKSYNADKMVHKKRYKANQDDFLVGSASSSGKIKFYLSPGKVITEGSVDNNRKWSYQIPAKLPPGRYSLYAAEFGLKSKVSSIKSFKINVKSNNQLLNFKQNVTKKFRLQGNILTPKLALAQDDVGSNLLTGELVLASPEEDSPEESTEEVVSFQPSIPEPQCTEAEWEENASCSNMACGEITQTCFKSGESRSIQDQSGLCSDPFVNPTCNNSEAAGEPDDIPILKFNELPAMTTDTSYDMNVLVIKYFPLTEDGTMLDSNIVKENRTYEQIKNKTEEITENLKNSIERASSYLGYSDPNAQPSLHYTIVDALEYKNEPPKKSDPEQPNHLDYDRVMREHNICDYVDNKGIKEVWIFAYQNENLGIWENIASIPEFKDVNQNIIANEIPECSKSYVVYTFNYIGGTAQAMESWGHRIENEIRTLDLDFFNNKFQGPSYPQAAKETGRCGSVHNPPNARREYDRTNVLPHLSDCLDWNPDNIGQTSEISCLNWSPNGCRDFSDTDNPYLNYEIWNWQNLPGRNNTKTYQGKQIRNLWDVHGDFDSVINNNRTIFLGGEPAINNPYNVSCSGIYNLNPQQTNISGATVHVNAGQSVSLKVNILNDINDRNNISWLSNGGSFNTAWDIAEYIVPKEEGEYQVWVSIYGKDQTNCRTTFTVGRIADRDGEPR